MKNFAVYSTKYGYFKIESENNVLTFLKKIQVQPIDVGRKTVFFNFVFKQLNEYFEGKRKSFNIPYKLKGTSFQIKVWKALETIAYGQTKTYKQVAIMIGNAKASRAVGMANNKNPISIIVPCHRVIGSDNKLVGYAGGLDMKRKLLKIENNKDYES